MIRLQLLGGLAAIDGSRPLGGNAQQPRRVAVLAVLGRAGARGVSRDRLATLIWEEVDEERSRKSLNQALYALRQELGSEEAILGTRDLRLNPEFIEVDVAAFETARDSGALETAAKVYAGPFLGDFHLPGAPAFARWAEEEREGLAGEYRTIVEALATGATSRNDVSGAVLWWRRLAALDPSDARAAQGVMRALAAAGDVPGALRHAEVFHQMRQQELELPPDPEVEALAERIRRRDEVAVRGADRRTGGPPDSESRSVSSVPPVSTLDPRPSTVGRRRLHPLAISLVVLLALGLLWRTSNRNESTAPKRIAVLPFENQGDSADAYFADGMTDELRGKLTTIPGFEVVASLSSNEYRASSGRLTQIAHDLGVGYLLIGKVTWQRGAGATSRVRVSPELIRIAPGGAPTTRWQQPFDAPLTDVFAVQADIAAKVAAALDIVLADSARRALTASPTDNLSAYDEFLKGEAAAQGMKADQAGLRRAIAFYARAVALDSTFAKAWSQLSRARTSLYSNGVPDTALATAARTAAERGARLKPNEPWVYLALGDYYGSVNPVDNGRAMQEYERGLRVAPNDVDLLSAAVASETSLGHWDGVAARLARVSALDPRSVTAARRECSVNLFLRRYPAADSAADRAVALAPASPAIVSLKIMVALARGDVAGARAAIAASAKAIDPTALSAFLAYYQDLYWLLDDRQQLEVLGLPVSAFDDDRGGWALVRTELYELRGDRHRMLVYADSARIALEAQSRAAPDDGQRRVLLGVALAYLGRKDEAIREGQRGLDLMPISRDGYFGPYVQLQLARIYILIGQQEKAMDQLEPLLQVPFYLSPGWLKVDPEFDLLRTHPRFRRLVGESATGEP